MANYQAAVSGNAYKNNGGTVRKAGNIATDNPITKAMTLRENLTRKSINTKNALASSPTSSGNLGTVQPLSGGTFGYDPPSNVSSSTAVTVIARRVSTTLSGAANTTLQSGASDKGIRQAVHAYTGNRLLGITSWNAVTGAATKSTTRDGLLLQASGIDGTLGRGADDTIAKSTFAIPGELVWIETGKTPTQKDYAAKYSP